MRKPTLTLLLACVIGAGSFVAAQSGPTTGTAALSGVVVDALTGAPLAGATVSLGRTDVQRPSPRMVTDSKGRFIFHNLPPSDQYFLDARRFGYANTRYGWTGPDGSSLVSAIRRIPLADGQWVSTISIPLWRFGAITGRVIDERGEPVVGIAVRAFAMAKIAGQSQLVGGPITTTDDRGAYRLSSVKPGRYVVSVLSVQSTVLNTTPEAPQARAVGELESGGYGAGRGNAITMPSVDVDGRHRLVITNFATPPPPAEGRTRLYPALFYPGVMRAADAEAIEIGYGDNRAAVDFQLQPVGGVRVSGRLESRSTLPEALLLRLMPSGSERLGPGSEAATTTSDKDGSFTFLNVPEGNYTLIAQASIVEMTSSSGSFRLAEPPGFPAGGISVGSLRGAPGLSYHVRSGQPSSLSGRAAVGVGPTDVTNLVVALNPAVKITGRIVFAEGGPPPPDLILGLTAYSAEGDMSLGQPRGEGVIGEGGMTFEVPGLIGGRYLLSAGKMLRSTPGGGTTGYQGPLSVMSITAGGRDVIDSGFDGALGVDFDDVVVTLTTKIASLTGVVRDDAGPVSCVVIAFPVERDRWVGFGLEPRRFRTAPAGLDGKFKSDDLPQGDYYLVAVDAQLADKWADPSFLAAAVPHATRVALKWGQAVTQDLKKVEVVVK